MPPNEMDPAPDEDISLPAPETGGGADDEPQPDFSDLLHSFGDDASLDDAESPELDAGVDIFAEDEEGNAEDEDPIDVGTVLPLVESIDVSTVEDEQGPVDPEPLSDFVDDSEAVGDDSEGAVEALDTLIGDLPVLEREDPDEEGSREAAEPLPLSDVDDRDATWPLHEWEKVTLHATAGACSALSPGAAEMFSAGETLLKLDANDHVQLVTRPPNTVASAVALSGMVVFATVAGQLFRVPQGGGPLERLSAFREAARLRPDEAADLELVRSGERLLLRTSTGAVLSSVDVGSSWERLPLPRALAISGGVSPLLVLDDAGTKTLRRLDREESMTPSGATSLLSAGCLIASARQVVALARPSVGLAVSSDGGQTFRWIVGAASITAVTVAELAGHPYVFCARTRAGTGKSEIFVIDATESAPYRIHVLESPALDDEDGADDDGRVVTLAWDDSQSMLWAGGSFGLLRLRRPTH